MHRTSSWVAPVAAVVVAVVVSVTLAAALSACGGSAPAAANLPSAAADQARASRLVLHLTDLPAGWTAVPYRPDPSQGSLDVELATCLGLPSFKPFQTAQVHSDRFTAPAGGFPQVTSEVTTFTDDRYPRQDLAALEGVEFAGCAAAQYRKLIVSAGQPVGNISVSLLPTEEVGDPSRVAGFRAHITMSPAASAPLLIVDMFVLVGRRVGATITFTNSAQAPPAALEQHLVALELTRVAS